MEESPSETHNYSGHPPTSQSRHPRTHPATRPPTLLPSLAMQLSSGVCMRSSAVLYIPCQLSPPTRLSTRRETDVTVTHFDSGPSRIISHGSPRCSIQPPTHPLLLPPLSPPESRLLPSSSHPVLHLHPFILDLSGLSSVVRYIQLVLLYVVSATVCCCLSLAFCCLSLFTAGLPLSAAAY